MCLTARVKSMLCWQPGSVQTILVWTCQKSKRCMHLSALDLALRFEYKPTWRNVALLLVNPGAIEGDPMLGTARLPSSEKEW